MWPTPALTRPHTLLADSWLDILRQASRGLRRQVGRLLRAALRLAVPNGPNHFPDERLRQPSRNCDETTCAVATLLNGLAMQWGSPKFHHVRDHQSRPHLDLFEPEEQNDHA
jgi:hypothetical protein